MAGKKGRSGPLGNLNNVQHPWRSFWARKALRQQDKWILPFLNRYIDEAIEDAGGDDISSGKQRTLEIAQLARGCAMLILKEVKEKGFTFTTPDGWEMHPGLKELSRFLDLELKARRNVGLERIRKPPKSLDDILTEVEDEKPNLNGATDGGTAGQ
jgi:hypothetical protein